MVEKVSKINVNTSLASGSVSDDTVLLEWVDKKKKQNRLDEQPSSAAVSAQMLVQVLNGGGWLQKENKAANAAAVPEPARQVSRNDEGMRNKVMLAASARTEATLSKPQENKAANAAAVPEPARQVSRNDEGMRNKVMLAASARTEATLSKPQENKAANAAAVPEPARQVSRNDEGMRNKVMLAASARTEATLSKPQENKAANAAAVPEPARQVSRNDEGMRNKVMLAASARTEATLSKPLTIGDKPVAAANSMKESESPPRAAITPVRQVDARAISPPVAVEATRIETAIISQPLTARVTKSEDASRYPESSLQRKDELNEERPSLAPGKAVDFRTNVQSERQGQTKAVLATLQQLKGQVNAATAAPSAKEAQKLEVVYSFQRWSGDHSVKVTIPAQALREGNMTLLPSDARAADALSRNLGTLAGHSPELLQPRQERDEQQKREQQPQQDEEQE